MTAAIHGTHMTRWPSSTPCAAALWHGMCTRDPAHTQLGGAIVDGTHTNMSVELRSDTIRMPITSLTMHPHIYLVPVL
jgi:hypothetical protein